MLSTYCKARHKALNISAFLLGPSSIVDISTKPVEIATSAIPSNYLEISYISLS
jgi:hypothetical protein